MKKHLLNFLLLIAPMALVTVNAQKTLKEGTIKMEITEVGSPDPQTAQMMEMMKGTTTEIFFKGDESVTSLSMMGGMMTTKTKMNKQSGKMDMLMDMMGQKIWVETDKVEAEKMQAQVKTEVKADKSDTKKILGYNAYKVNIINKDDANMQISGYVTEEINASAEAIQGMQGVDLPGFPLMIMIKSPDMSMTIATTDIKDSVDESKLKTDTSGYKKMTMEEFQKTMGGMGGGLGF